MSKKKELKIKFFQRGVKAINGLIGKNEGFYYCPICMLPFSKDALDVNELTLEHIPPEAQKGKGIALTCSKCNHTAGHTIDAAVSNRNEVFRIEPLFTKKGEYKGRVIVSFGEADNDAMNFNLLVKDSAIRFFPVEGSNRPEASERIKNFFLNLNKTPDQDKPTFKVTTRKRYHGWYSKIGDLRTAYLVCFAFFGYRYVFDCRLDPVRNQILNYHDKIIDGFWLQSDLNDESDTNLYLINKPFSAISVRIGKISVLLPWFDSPENFYEFLINQFIEDWHINFTGTRLQWPTSLEMKLDFYKK
jgi:hypothetical protein